MSTPPEEPELLMLEVETLTVALLWPAALGGRDWCCRGTLGSLLVPVGLLGRLIGSLGTAPPLTPSLTSDTSSCSNQNYW